MTVVCCSCSSMVFAAGCLRSWKSQVRDAIAVWHTAAEQAQCERFANAPCCGALFVPPTGDHSRLSQTRRCVHTRASCAIRQQSHGRWDVTGEPGTGPILCMTVLKLQSYAGVGEVVWDPLGYRTVSTVHIPPHALGSRRTCSGIVA